MNNEDIRYFCTWYLSYSEGRAILDYFYKPLNLLSYIFMENKVPAMLCLLITKNW
tara:strand:+ start:200 stop:364 length:165 start_codon:yes stop_codon:yes gene_type:complete